MVDRSNSGEARSLESKVKPPCTGEHAECGQIAHETTLGTWSDIFAHGHLGARAFRPSNPPCPKVVPSSSRRVLAVCGTQLVCGEIKRIAGHHVFNLNPSDIPDLDKSVTWIIVSREQQGASTLNSFKQSHRGRHHIHLAVAEQDIAIAAEPPGACVLMLVGVVGVEEGARDDYEVHNWKGIALGGCRVPAERVVDCPPVVFRSGYLAVPIKRSIAPRCRQSLHFDAFGGVYQSQIWVAVPTGIVVIDTSLAETSLNPTLKVELFIVAPLTSYQLTANNGSIHRPKGGRD